MQLREKEKQAKKNIKRQAQLAYNVILFFERNLNSFLNSLLIIEHSCEFPPCLGEGISCIFDASVHLASNL